MKTPVRHYPRPVGFTLIELLIVVAIIAILAAIAVPNFLEAQTRSKISRAKADLAAVTVALEAYRVENNDYPRYGSPFDEDQGNRGGVEVNAMEAFLPTVLTTPVPYLSSLLKSPYPDVTDFPMPFAQPYRYVSKKEFYAREPFNGPIEWPDRLKSVFGNSDLAKEWSSFCYGPDRLSDDGAFEYDPTNGTVSTGDIVHYGPG
jgi:type II secretion system protein G